MDIRDQQGLEGIFRRYGSEIMGVIHCAAQPSHDWAAEDPRVDFEINAVATLDLLDLARNYSPATAFIYMSTNKVYGDGPNRIPFVELERRYEAATTSEFFEHGVPEQFPIDGTLHSLFGVSKASADLLVQEYGRYFGMKTVVFRGGCLTGPKHQGTSLHGFLSYLVKCAVHGSPYEIFGFKGKQVRDNIHSRDLVSAFWEYFQNPSSGEVFNIGGSRFANTSILEAIRKLEVLTGRRMDYSVRSDQRRGDHQWYVSDVRKFQEHYPAWQLTVGIDEMVEEMVGAELFES